jgi:hypothetical protein
MDDDAINERVTPINDSSGNANHGEFENFSNVISAFNGDVPANIGTGKSLDFDGVNDRITVPEINLTNDFSISIWTKYEGSTVTPLGPMFYGGGLQSSGANYRAYLWYEPSTDTFYLRYNGETDGFVYTNPILEDGNFHHLLVTRSGTTNKFFIDDVQVYSATDTVKTFTMRNLGWSYSSYYLDGKLDDARIYNRALTNGEIAFLYNGSGADPGTSNLQALWTFDDFAPVKDASGNANHGVGSGGVSLKYSEGILKR